jgi:cytochrome c-type biogenesis protein CcmH
MKGQFAIAALVIVLAGGFAATAHAQTPPPSGAEAASQGETQAAEPVQIRASLPDLEDEVMCPICGTLLGMSRAPAAERQRVFMRKLILEGKTNEQIKDALVAEYGPQVLGLPDDDEINFFVYLVPLLGLILATLGVLWAALRWRRSRDGRDPDGKYGDTASRQPDGPEEARLDRDLAEYDL